MSQRQEQPRKEPLRRRAHRTLVSLLPWLGVAVVAWGVAELYTPAHAAVVAGIYPVVTEFVGACLQVAVRIWGRPLPSAPKPDGNTT